MSTSSGVSTSSSGGNPDAGVGDGGGTGADAGYQVDAGQGDGGAPAAPNVAAVFGYPYTSVAPFQLNTDAQTACEDETPNATSPTLPPRPAESTNCAGNPNLCGQSGAQSCSAEPAASTWLHRVTVDTDRFPNAVCNDGSPAVFEVRAGSGAGTDRWGIWFKGGGSCYSQHECAQRWCGNQAGDKYTAAVMSTDWNGDGLVDRPHCTNPEPGSMFDTMAGNPFSTVNSVLIWYCSSDTYGGQAADVLLEDTADDDATPRNFTMHYRGHEIVVAVVAMLKEGVTSDDGVVTLPSIDLATDVLVSGSSAGGVGALKNMDFVHQTLRNTNSTVNVKGLIDAAMPPSAEALDGYPVYFDGARDELATPGAVYSQVRIAYENADWTTGMAAAMNAFDDETCMAAHGVTDPATCSIPPALILAPDGPFIETELFLRMDLGDRVIGGPFLPCEDPITELGCYTPNHSRLSSSATGPGDWLDIYDGSDLNRTTLVDILADGRVVTGVFSPACGTHTGLTNNNYTQQTVTDFDESTGTFVGQPRTFAQTLVDWLVNGGPIRVIDASQSSPLAPSSVCNGDPG
ncbi:MAG: pectin acetylesterase-family hydrolase [Myxococcota bacterium]